MSVRPELKALTGARGIAAWLVVLFHLRFMIPGMGGPRGWLAEAYLAVDFFFVLSGFVIWLTWSERLRQAGPAGIPEFLKRRIARIWPLHAVMLGVAMLFAVALIVAGRPDMPQYPPAELPLHFLLIQNWGLTGRLTWNVPAWSISCELAAYLVFAWLVMAVDWRRWPSWALIAAMVGFAAALWLIFTALGATVLGNLIERFGVVRCLAEFGIGTIACALWLRWRDRPLMPALGCIGIGAALLSAHALGLVPQILAMPLVFAELVLMLALSAGMRGNVMEWTPVHYLGEISYATYLGHWILWMAFKLAFVPKSGMGWPMALGFLALVLAASVLLHHLVERPAQRWINARPLPFRRTDTAAI